MDYFSDFKKKIPVDLIVHAHVLVKGLYAKYMINIINLILQMRNHDHAAISVFLDVGLQKATRNEVSVDLHVCFICKSE